MRKYFITVILLGTIQFIYAQQTNTFSFQHCALGVHDVNESASFYMEVLGFKEIPNRAKSPGIRWLSLGNGQELHLIQIDSLDLKHIKHTHLAWSTPQFKAFLEVLEAHDLDYSDWEGTKEGSKLRADGVAQVYFQDPNGYWIEINDEYKK